MSPTKEQEWYFRCVAHFNCKNAV